MRFSYSHALLLVWSGNPEDLVSRTCVLAKLPRTFSDTPFCAFLQSLTDPIYGYLVADASFVAAVKRQDVTQAAQAAAKTIKAS